MAQWPYNTADWQRLRKAKLAADPLCEDCLAADKLTSANCVDHRRAISDGGHPFPPLDQLSSKCWPCHSRKTARGPEAGAAKAKPRLAIGIDGWPLEERTNGEPKAPVRQS